MPVTVVHVEAMVMGDLVLFEDAMNPVMSALLENGVDGTALGRKSPKSAASYELVKLTAKSTIDGAKVESALGVKGQSKDGLFKAVMGRETSASCGWSVGKAMGLNTWAPVAGADDNVVVDGHFAVAEAERRCR